MSKIKVWVQAARLRTLPLSVSGIVVGSAAAYASGITHDAFWSIFSWAILTTLLLQILSNFANDYGDGVKGTDNETRIGPQRAVQSGAITAKEMKKAVIGTALASLVAAITLIYISFGAAAFWTSLFFFVLGVCCVGAAIKYTVGQSAYGYRGLGDVFVFIFFGLVSVLGSQFLYTQQFDYVLILPAYAVGSLSIAVLNLNNMRDLESDRTAGKITWVVILGLQNAKYYHYFIIGSALLALLGYSLYMKLPIHAYFFVVAYLPFIRHMRVVYQNRESRALDLEMKKVALGTFFLSVLFSLALIL